MRLTTLCIDGHPPDCPYPPSLINFRELLHLNQAGVQQFICNLTDLFRPIHGRYILEQRWRNRKKFVEAVKLACLGNFTFHNLRHFAINNLRLAGNDRFLIEQASVHKTISAFKRYNLVTEEEIKKDQMVR